MFYIANMKSQDQYSPIAITPPDLGAWFRRERRALRLTQTEVATQVGCRRQTIAELESGENIGLHTLMRALAALNMALAIRPMTLVAHELHLLLDPEDRDE